MRQIVLLFTLLFLLTGCRGYLTEKPPIHLNPNMDWQAKYKAQTLPLTPPDGTVIWGRQSTDSLDSDREFYLQPDNVFYTGKKNGVWSKTIPVEVNKKLLLRGQDQYNIYCAVCHTQTGNGLEGPITKRGWIVSNILDDVTYNRPDGELFDIIRNGIRSMPGYAIRIREDDTWAIVAYMRALQETQRGKKRDVPFERRSEIK